MKAQDGSGFAQEVTVDVAIKNKNDNSPIAESDFFTGYIEENSSEDKLILTAKGHPLVVAARDRDIQHSKLKYQIINSAVTRYFKIDESTGEIRTTKVRCCQYTKRTDIQHNEYINTHTLLFQSTPRADLYKGS